MIFLRLMLRSILILMYWVDLWLIKDYDILKCIRFKEIQMLRFYVVWCSLRFVLCFWVANTTALNGIVTKIIIYCDRYALYAFILEMQLFRSTSKTRDAFGLLPRHTVHADTFVIFVVPERGYLRTARRGDDTRAIKIRTRQCQ